MNPEQDKVDFVEETFRKRRKEKGRPIDQLPLQIAIFKGGVAMCLLLVKFKLCSSYCRLVTEHKQTAMILLELGSDVKVKDYFGLTPLLSAAARNMTSLFVKIEQQGAEIQVRRERNIIMYFV